MKPAEYATLFRPTTGTALTQHQQAALLRRLEESLLDPAVRHSPDKITELLADEFIEFGRSGTVYDKASIIRTLGAEAIQSAATVAEIRDFSARALSAELVLLTYRAVERSYSGGTEIHSLRSSLWKLIDRRWQMVFHQGTPVSSSGK